MDSAEKNRLNITENRQLVLGCINYEIAQGKGVYEAFQSLSKTLGEGTISYKEFDFLYHQYYHGEFDVEYDMRLETSKPKLTDLPPEILVKSILNQLGWKDRISLRQVSKAFQTLTDGLKYRVYNKVDLKIYEPEEVELVIDDQYFYFSAGCLEAYCDISEDSESFKCVGDFKDVFPLLFRLLSAPGVKTKQFDVTVIGKCDDGMLQTVKKTVKSSENRMAVRRFEMDVAFEDQMTVFMTCFEPGVLEKMYISAPDHFHAEEIIFTEHWKQSKELTMLGLQCSLSNFLHCARFTIILEDGLTDVDLLDIKNACFESPTFEFCHLLFDVDVDRVGAILGPKKIMKPDGNIFSIKYDKEGIIFKHNNHFDFVGLTITGDESAVLKLDGESIEYEIGIERNDGNKKPGNWKHALAHLAEAWRISKLEIEKLEIEFHSLGAKANEIQEAVKTFFKTFRYKIPVTSLHMKIDSEDQLEVVLPHLEPKTLETIKIDGNGSIGEDEEGQAVYLRIEKGLKCAQWTGAWDLHVSLIELPFESLLHFQVCTAFLHQINEEEILQMKKKFFAKCQRNCSLTLHFRDAFDEERIKLLLGPSEVEVPDRNSSATFTIEVETCCIRFEKTSRYRREMGGRFPLEMNERWMVRGMIGSDESESDSDDSDSDSDGSDGDLDQSYDSYESDGSDGSDQSEESESSDL